MCHFACFLDLVIKILKPKYKFPVLPVYLKGITPLAHECCTCSALWEVRAAEPNYFDKLPLKMSYRFSSKISTLSKAKLLSGIYPYDRNLYYQIFYKKSFLFGCQFYDSHFFPIDLIDAKCIICEPYCHVYSSKASAVFWHLPKYLQVVPVIKLENSFIFE